MRNAKLFVDLQENCHNAFFQTLYTHIVPVRLIARKDPGINVSFAE